MFNVLMTIEILVSALLIVVVLMQASKGGGLAGTFGGANVGMVFGVRRTADFLVKSTQVLAVSFAVLALVINMFFLPRPYEGGVESILQSGSQQQQTPPSAPQLPPSQQAPPLGTPPQSGTQQSPPPSPGSGQQQ